MSILDDIGSYELPVLDEAIMEGVGRAFGPGQHQRSEPKLIWPRRFPATTSTIAVEAHADLTVGFEVDGVFGLVVGCQRRIIATLKLDQLPGGAVKVDGDLQRRGLGRGRADER